MPFSDSPTVHTAQSCPGCRCDLARALESGQRRCPECGYRFTPEELAAYHNPNREGEPRQLSPHERRIKGRWLLLALAVISAVFVGTVFIINLL